MSEKITFQQIFDKAWQAFIVEDKLPAVNESGNCVYEDSDGNCCAIGLVLPEGHISRRLTGDFYSLVAEYPDLFADDIRKAGYFDLANFQRRLHDHLIKDAEWAIPKEERKQRYIQVAKDYNLTIPGEQNDK